MDNPVFIDHTEVIRGLWEVKLPKYSDIRGSDFEGLNRHKYPDAFKPFFDKTPVDSFSISTRNVLRGFHGDFMNYKLIQILDGKIQFVVIDSLEDSRTFGNSLEFIVAAKENRQFLLVPGIVNAHLVLSDKCIFTYKLSEDYAPPERQIHIKWNKYKLPWRTNNPIMSERDR